MLSNAVYYFREAARSGSLRRAAERLSVAPSAISRQIAKLEAELGIALLDRRSRGMVLTEAGRLVFAYTERIEEDLNTIRESIRNLAGASTGHVRVVSVEGMVSYFLSKYVSGFEKEHPGVRVHVSVVGSRSVLDTLRDARADMALAFGIPPRKGFVQHARHASQGDDRAGSIASARRNRQGSLPANRSLAAMVRPDPDHR